MLRKINFNVTAIISVALGVIVSGCQTKTPVMQKLPDTNKIQTQVYNVAKDRQVVDFETRKGAMQRILFITPKNPKAAVILFAGGGGKIEIQTDGSILSDGNFLVRSRERFVKQSYMTAVFDVLTDQSTLRDNRTDSWHVWDVATVVAYIKNRYGLPVWLVGTSRGAMTIGYVGAQLSKFIDGVAFTASMDDAAHLPLNQITVPAFVIHHARDDCFVTNPSSAKDFAKELVKSPKVELLFLNGGIDQGNPCQAQSHHGFNGIEDEAVGKIAGFINQILKRSLN
jgi:predicted alpha/beta-fold hydrolase